MISLGSSRRSARPAFAALFATVALTATLAGCSVIEGPTPERPERPAVPEVADPVFVPGGSAEENLPIFTDTIRSYVEGDDEILGEPVVNAIAEVGFSKSDMQVTFDRTKTDLPADNLFVSVRLDEECLVGQLIPESRDFAVKLVDAIGPANDICIIGETREITW